MTIQEKRNQIAARMNAAYLRYDYAGVDAAGAALRRLDAVIADIAEDAKVIHYDFCSAKYRGNAAFYGGELVSAYLRENDDPELAAKPSEMVIGRNGRPVQKIFLSCLCGSQHGMAGTSPETGISKLPMRQST